MADPRLAAITHVGTSYERRETYKIDGVDIVFDATQPNGSAVCGRAVTMSADQTVRLAGDAQMVKGQLVSVESDGTCTVIVEGRVKLPGGTAATLTAGSKIVGALLVAARGYIRNVAPATLAEVAVAAHTINDASVSTAVEVDLH